MNEMNDRFRAVHFVECHCGHYTVLPRQSPLGMYEDLDYRPTVEWPATFLCIGCGRLSVHSQRRFGQVQAMDQNPPADLWKIVLRCDQENCERTRTIYTTGGPSAAEADVKNIVFRRLSTIQGGAGHSFAVSDKTLKGMERFVW